MTYLTARSLYMESDTDVSTDFEIFRNLQKNTCSEGEKSIIYDLVQQTIVSHKDKTFDIYMLCRLVSDIFSKHGSRPGNELKEMINKRLKDFEG